MSKLSRQGLQNGSTSSVELTSAVRVSADEYLLIYDIDTDTFADIFLVPDHAAQEVLDAGATGGEHLNAILAAGGFDFDSQPVCVAARLIIE